MSVSEQDRQIIQGLAKQVAEIAALPIHEEKIELWKRLNRLERVRPLVHVQAIAASIWVELLPEDQLQTSDPFCRGQEMALRRKIYCWEHFPDDRVVDAIIRCPIQVRGDSNSTGFGLRRATDHPKERFGAWAVKPILNEEEDIEGIKTDPEVWVDWEQTEHHYERLCDLYEGTLNVEKEGTSFFWFHPMDTFIVWRGIEQTFVDLVERPAWIHEALERMTIALLSSIEQIEKLHALSRGDGNTMLGSGGYGWSDELPQPDFDGEHVRLRDLWARAATQIFTDLISPEMHEEFAIQYEKRLLERFGLSCYGCCEPLHNKMHVVRKIRNLRRVSMSPWVDIEAASDAVGTDYIYTHKPNPTIISMHTWDPELAREDLRTAFAKTRENIVEVNFQDLHTVRNEPHRLTEWTQIAMELAEEYA